jgi:hypothetical protein
MMDMEDVIQFDDEPNDSDAPTTPIFVPAVRSLSNLGNDFSHLTNNNVTAFRRDHNPSNATLANLNNQSFSRNSEFSTPARSRKRKTVDSPYTSSHYNGVTPVQRMMDTNPPSTPDSALRTKRRRMMTA